MDSRTIRGKTAVAGIGETTYYKHGQSPDSEFVLVLKAILAASGKDRLQHQYEFAIWRLSVLVISRFANTCYCRFASNCSAVHRSLRPHIDSSIGKVQENVCRARAMLRNI